MKEINITLDTNELSEIKLALDLRASEIEGKLARLGGYEGGYSELLEKDLEFVENLIKKIKEVR